MGAPLFIPRPLRRPITVSTARAMKLAAPVLTPVARRIPMGPVSTTVLRFSGFMFPTARPTEVRRAVRGVPHHSRSTGTCTSPCTPPGTTGCPSRASPCPAVFVAGRYDVLADTKDMRTASERIDGATYRELIGTHFLPLERPRAVAQLLRDFLDAVEG